MSIKDKLYGPKGHDPAARPQHLGPGVALEASGPALPTVGMASVAIGDATGTVSDDLMRVLHRRLLQTRERRPGDALLEPEISVRRRVTELLAQVATDPEFAVLPNLQGQLQVIGSLRDRFVDFVARDVMALGPLNALLVDRTVTEIMVNGAHSIFYEQNGSKQLARGFLDELQLRAVTSRILETAGRTLDTRVPILDVRLRDGTQLEIIQPPVSLDGLSLTFRKVPPVNLDLEALVAQGMLGPKMATFLELAVRARVNLVIAGTSGAGKTTLLNALAGVIPHEERVVLIEEVPQVRVSVPNRVHLQPQPGDGHTPEITARELVRAALRMRPSRILLGEIRGPETLDLLMAMGAGQDGCMTTTHAPNAREAMRRMQTLAQMSGEGVAEAAINRQIGLAVQLVVQVERAPDGARRVIAITAVQGQSSADVPLTFTDVFMFHPGARGHGGEFRATGVVPHFHARLQSSGGTVPPDLYTA